MVDLKAYEKKITKIIKKILEMNKMERKLDDILLNMYIEKHEEDVKKALLLKQLQMKIGEIWQKAIGNFDEFIDLGTGDRTGLDIRNRKRKIVIELKNRYNTDNHSSKESNLKKLVKFKKKHPKYECIYGVINEKSNKPDGCTKVIIHDDIEIKYYSGKCLLNHIFGENVDDVIKILKKIIGIYLD